MKTVFVFMLTTLVSTAAFAQTPRAYISGNAGLAVSPDGTSGDLLSELGVRLTQRVSVFGSIGQFHNLEPSAIDTAVVDTQKALFVDDGLNVRATSRVPALYSMGGVRVNGNTHGRITPYVTGGAGVARIEPQASFTTIDGSLDGSFVNPGTDVTTNLESMGLFKKLTPTNEFLYSAGAGANVAIDRHLILDGGYRYSHVAGDSPLHAQSVTVGLGYRF